MQKKNHKKKQIKKQIIDRITLVTLTLSTEKNDSFIHKKIVVNKKKWLTNLSKLRKDIERKLTKLNLCSLMKHTNKPINTQSQNVHFLLFHIIIK